MYKIVDIGERKKILSIKRRCRHHTSVCDKANPSPVMCQPNQRDVIYPVVVVEVEGIRCRASLDTGSGNWYVTSTYELDKKETNQTRD